MSLFTRRRSVPVEERDGNRQLVYVQNGFGYFVTGDGVSSDPLRSVAHWACRRVLCTEMSALPVMQVRESGGRRTRIAESSIVREPSAQVDQMTWVYQVMDSWLDCGNVYGLVQNPTSTGFPGTVEIVAPSEVSWQPHQGALMPHINGEPYGIWPRGLLWHAPAFARAGSPIGLSPSEHFAMSMRTAQAAEKFGADFFADGAHPTHKVKVNDEIDEDEANDIKAAVMRAARTRQPFVHGSDIELEPMQVNPNDSQFLELLRFECEQASRIYGVPPAMIYAAVSGQNVTYANVSDADLAFLKHSLRYWVRLLQRQWSRFLPAPQVVRLNTDAILEMTPEQRAKVNEIRLRSKTITINEVRDLEDQERFDDPMYDEPGVPGGMAPAGTGEDEGGAADGPTD